MVALAGGGVKEEVSMTMRSVLWTGVAMAIFAGSVAIAEPLPADPRVQTGKLANGVTWIYQHHDNPPGKMALMVRVGSGSLNETDQQLGLAHFVAHLARKATEHFPPGELTRYYESLGMDVEDDSSAFASFNQSGYMLFLPDNSQGSIDRGLMALSDYVFRATFDPETIEKERKVMLSQWKLGRNAEDRVLKRELEFVFSGSRIAGRQILGEPEIIEKAPRSEFIDYYRTWYRPELITVILVGDVPLASLLPAVDKWFGKYEAPVPVREAKGAEFKLFSKPRAYVITDPELGGCEVGMINIEPARPAQTTVEQFRAELLERVSSWIAGRRLSERVQTGEAAYTHAVTYVVDYYQGGVVAGAAAWGKPEDWQRMMGELIYEVNRAREHGFTLRELELAKKELLAEAERKVDTESARSAKSVMMELCGAVNDGEPVVSPRQRLELVRKLLPSIQLAEVNGAFRRHYGAETFAYGVMLPDKEGVLIPTRGEVLSAAIKARAKRTKAISRKEAITSLLSKEPVPGAVVEKTVDEDLGVTSLWLDNGVRVHLRRMEHEKDEVLASISLAGGRIEESTGTLGNTIMVSNAMRKQPATRSATSTEIRDLMTGKKVTVWAGAGTDRLVFNVAGSPKDLEEGFRLVYALLTEGVIEESALRVWKSQQSRYWAMLNAFPEYRAYQAMAETLYEGDPRQKPLLEEKSIAALTLEGAQSWFDRMRTESPLEIAVAGEIDIPETIRLVEKYFGSLPKRPRSAGEKLNSLRKLKLSPGPWNKHVVVETVTPKAMAIAGFIGCDLNDIHDRRGLELASTILNSRMIRRVREELALAYSLEAASNPGVGYEGGGLFLVAVPCEPEAAKAVVREIHLLFEDFAAKGPTETELANARKQIANNLDESMRGLKYWIGVLGDLDYHHKSLKVVKQEQEAYSKYTREDVVRVFRKYYNSERRYTFIATPAAESGKEK